MITKKEMNKIKKFAIHLDWDIAFDGKSKGNKHLFRVSSIAVDLAKKEGGRKDIIQAAAWLHNVGLINGDKNHDVTGKQIAKEFLDSIKINSNDCKNILHCIESHEGNLKAATIEAKIVHDADVIDKMGPLGIIRQTWKLANSGINTESICDILPIYMAKRKKRVYTKTAKIIANNLSSNIDKFFIELTSQLKGKIIQ